MNFACRIGAAILMLAVASQISAQPSPAAPSPQSARSRVVPLAPGLDEVTRLYRRGELDAALERVEALLQKEPNAATFRFLHGLILADQKRIPEAIEIFTRLAEERPDLPEPHNNLAVLYAERGDLDKARLHVERALLAHPDNVTALENLGDIHARLAVRSYERALVLNPKLRSARAKLDLLQELSSNPSEPTQGDPE